MIVITKVEFFEIDRDIVEIPAPQKPLVTIKPSDSDRPTQANTQFIKEIVRGRRFRNSNGVEVVIGNSCDVENVIGFQVDAWEGMQQDLEDERDQKVKAINSYNRLLDFNNDLKNKIRRIEGMGFFGRLKYVLFSILPDRAN